MEFMNGQKGALNDYPDTESAKNNVQECSYKKIDKRGGRFGEKCLAEWKMRVKTDWHKITPIQNADESPQKQQESKHLKQPLQS